jgi:hypothetical protein
MGFAHRALVAAGVGFAAAVIAGCGSSGGSLLSASQSSQLSEQLNRVTQALNDSDCSAAREYMTDFQDRVDELGGVNSTLISDLDQGASTIQSLAESECQTTTTQTTPKKTHPKTTTQTTPSTTTTFTVPSTTSTYTAPSITTTTYSTPSTTPNGGECLTDCGTTTATTTSTASSTTSPTGGNGLGSDTTTTTDTATTGDTVTTTSTTAATTGAGF